MPAHFTIYKVQPSTGKRVILHHNVPEQLSDWLCKMCDLELTPADRAHGYVIVKETIGKMVAHAGNHPRAKAG